MLFDKRPPGVSLRCVEPRVVLHVLKLKTLKRYDKISSDGLISKLLRNIEMCRKHAQKL